MTHHPNATPRKRIYFLDNLRTFMIFLVVVAHAGVVYESSGIGAYFWIVDDPSTNHLVGILNIIMGALIMPILFFVSGFFSYHSVKSKTGIEFAKAKFKRLMIPWAIAIVTLIPLFKVLFLYSRGLPQEHWTTYFHFTNGVISQSWMWFLPILFFFNLLLLGISKMRLDTSKITLKRAILGAFSVALAYNGCIDALGWQGWTKTLLVDFQTERLFVMLFFLVSLACLVYTLIVTFWTYFDQQKSLGAALSKNSYGVYIIHVIVLGGFAFCLLDTTLPSLLKYLVLSILTDTASNLLVWVYCYSKARIRRQPKSQRIERGHFTAPNESVG